MQIEESVIKEYEEKLISAGVKISFITTELEKRIELYSYLIDSKFIIKKGEIYKDDNFSIFAIYDIEQYKPSDKDIGRSILTLQTFLCELISAIDNHKNFKRYY